MPTKYQVLSKSWCLLMGSVLLGGNGGFCAIAASGSASRHVSRMFLNMLFIIRIIFFRVKIIKPSLKFLIVCEKTLATYL